MARQIDSDLLTPDKPLYKKFQMSLAIQGIVIGIQYYADIKIIIYG